MRRTILITAVFAFIASSVGAGEQLPELKDKVVYVAVFKSGIGFFLREGNAPLKSGWGMTRSVPDAAFGTFWIAPRKDGARIDQLVAHKEEVSKLQPAAGVRELLSANMGKKATVAVGDKSFTGTIISSKDEKAPNNPEVRTAGNILSDPLNVLILQTAPGKVVALNTSSISWVEIEGDPSTSVPLISTERRMKYKITGAGESCPVSTAYLQKGITWAPAYLIELQKDNKARVTMQGLLANDAEDLENVNVSFVVGFPNFVYSDIMSPLALRHSVGEFIQALTSGGRYATDHRGSARVVSQSVLSNIGDYVQTPAEPEGFSYSTVTDTPGSQEEDLFLYKKTGVTLKKGERAYYDIFSTVVAFEHIYEWESPDESRVDVYGNVQSYRSDEPRVAQNQVWHKLKLKNSSDYPWTTAPVFTLSDGQPLAEDILDYTSKGGIARVKLTVATDIKSKAEEEEVSRETAKMPGYDLWKVTSKGRLTLKNYKTTEVKVSITKHITGEAVTVSDGGKAVKTSKGIKAINPTSTISWDIPLKPGEEKGLEYTYVTLIRY